MKNRTLKIALIVLLSIVMISLIVLMINMLQGNFKFSNIFSSYKISNELVIDEEYSQKFKMIEIDATSSEVYIKNGDSEDTRVVIYGKKEDTEVDITDERLKIVTKEKACVGFCFNIVIPKIEVYLPKEYADRISIKNNFGDIRVDGFANASIQIEENCGDVIVSSGDYVEIDNEYGDIELNHAKKAKVKQDCGDIKIGSVDELEAENNYGDIEIEKINKKFNITNDCGDIEIDSIDISEDSYLKDDFGDIEVGNTNEVYIDAKTDLGDVKINNNYNKSEITLKIENDCGDIKVKN